MIVSMVKPGWWMGKTKCAYFFGTSQQEVRAKYFRWLQEQPEWKARPKHA